MWYHIRYRIKYHIRYRIIVSYAISYMLSQKICDIACDIACDITKISHIPVVDRCDINKKCAISHAISQKIAISHAISHEISHRDLLLTTQNMRYRMRYRIRYRLRCYIACDIVWLIAWDIPMMRYRMDFLCNIVYDILTCACFVCLLSLPLRPLACAPPALLSASRNCGLMILMPRCEDWQLLERV